MKIKLFHYLSVVIITGTCAITNACKSQEILPPPTIEVTEYNPFGPNITKMLEEFKADETVLCKTYFRGKASISGIKDNHPWFQIFDYGNDKLFLEWTSTETIAYPYDMGYGEFWYYSGIFPYFIEENGRYIIWVAGDLDIPNDFLCWVEFINGSTSRFSIIEFIDRAEVFYPQLQIIHDCAYFRDKCYSLDGEYLFTRSDVDKCFYNNPKWHSVYTSREEILYYGLNQDLEIVFVKVNLRTGTFSWCTGNTDTADYKIYSEEYCYTDTGIYEFKVVFVVYDGTKYYRTAKINVESGEILSCSNDEF